MCVETKEWYQYRVNSHINLFPAYIEIGDDNLHCESLHFKCETEDLHVVTGRLIAPNIYK